MNKVTDVDKGTDMDKIKTRDGYLYISVYKSIRLDRDGGVLIQAGDHQDVQDYHPTLEDVRKGVYIVHFIHPLPPPLPSLRSFFSLRVSGGSWRGKAKIYRVNN